MTGRSICLLGTVVLLAAACGGKQSSQTVAPLSAGCASDKSSYVDVNNHTGANAAIYTASGQYLGDARPGLTTWRLPPQAGLVFVGGATREPYPKDKKKNPKDSPDVKFAYRCE